MISAPPPTHQVLRSIYQPPGDNNFYHITCKMMENMENPDFLGDDDYDFEFFYQDPNYLAKYHVKCKLIPHPLVISILKEEVHGMNFEVDDLKRRYLSLTSHQKLNLEIHLKQVLPFYLDTSSGYNGGNTISFREIIGNNATQSASMVDSQNYSDNVMLSNAQEPTHNRQVLRSIYQPPSDNNFYQITSKMMGNTENADFLCDDNYDFEFFYQRSNYLMKYHVKCKLLPHPLVISILKKEVCGMNFDVDDLKWRYLSLTSHQKLNLEIHLKQVLPFYLDTSSGYNGNTSSFREIIGNNQF